MKHSLLLLGLSFLAFGFLRIWAQTTPVDTDNPDTIPPGSTVITSDELRMDQNTHISVFTGNVVVVGSNFHMTADEMTVYSTKDNKVEHIVAKYNVIILQPGRVTHCGQAIYYHDTDMFDLTDRPDIKQNTDEIQAPEIIIYRTKGTLTTKGHTTTTILDKGMNPSTNSTVAPAAPTSQ